MNCSLVLSCALLTNCIGLIRCTGHAVNEYMSMVHVVQHRGCLPAPWMSASTVDGCSVIVSVYYYVS